MSEEEPAAAVAPARPLRPSARWWLGMAGAIVVLGGAIAVVPPRPEPAPPPAVRTIGGFPEYFTGARIVAAASRELPVTEVRLTFVPTTRRLKLFTRCGLDPTDRLNLSVTVNEHGTVFTPCGSGGVQVFDEFDEAGWAGKDVTVGVETTIVAGLHGDGRATGTFAVAIGEVVPPDQYPYPPRPSALAGLGPLAASTDAVLRPDGPKEAKFRWNRQGLLIARLNTPGRLRMFLDGVEVAECESWDYSYQSCSPILLADVLAQKGVKVADGQDLTMTVIAERTTGDWDVAAYPA